MVNWFVYWAKKLPGFGLVFLIVTLIYANLRKDPGELTTLQGLAATVLCWIVYQLAFVFDHVYDWAYSTDSKLRFLCYFQTLEKARNRAAAALFGPIDPDVSNYSLATEYRYVGKKPLKSLYFFCSTIAKPTDIWTDEIAPKIEVSKAARTIFAFALLALLFFGVQRVRDLVGLSAYVDRFGLLSHRRLTITILAVTALVAFVIYFILRVLHNIELFEYVASEVTHVRKKLNRRSAVIFEVTLPRKPLRRAGMVLEENGR